MQQAWQGNPADDRGKDQPRTAWPGPEDGAPAGHGTGTSPPGDQLPVGDDDAAASAENAQNEELTMTMPGIAGYEFVNPSFTTDEAASAPPPYIPPPAYNELYADTRPTPAGEPGADQQTLQAGHIDETQAREALLAYVALHCCFGKGAAKNMAINSITPSNALHYTLESYIEMRTTYWSKVPHTMGLPVDGPMNGPAPAPWNILCTPAAMFADQRCILEVPHTSHVAPCPQCGSTGRVRCRRCFGIGLVRCISCGGLGRTSYTDSEGHRRYRMCSFCFGTGRRRCAFCHGRGHVTCPCCKGHCYLRFFIVLQIDFKNNLSEHIVERTDMTNSLISSAPGTEVFRQAEVRVPPVLYHPEQEIRDASQRFIQQDSTRFPTARILMQRQILRMVPVSECAYSWKDKTGRFWVYGTDHRVEAPDYPQTCCCGCTIL